MKSALDFRTRLSNYARRIAVTATLFSLAACGGGGSSNSTSGPPTSAPQPMATATPTLPPLQIPSPAPAQISGDDWFTFAHDYARTGFQQQSTGITAANVGSLTMRWSYGTGQNLYTAPLVYGGNVILTSLQGYVFDISSKTGALLWSRNIGGEIRATPTIDGGLVFVGNRFANSTGLPAPSQVYALRLVDGSIAWQAQISGPTHASPVVANGVVYMPSGGGDDGSCINGGISAFSELSGAPVWKWVVNPEPNGGGSVWGSPAFDGAHLFFGTGNTCQDPEPLANGAAAIYAKDAKLGWVFGGINDASIDDDTGSAVMLWNGKATFMNKNGTLYTVNESTGHKVWSTYLGAADQRGGFASPTTDGTTIYEGAGYFSTATASALRSSSSRRSQWGPFPVRASSGDISYLCALDQFGNLLWKKQMTNWIVNYVATTNGLAFAGLDNQLVAMDSRTGNTLWSYTSGDIFVASPVIVQSGVYAADFNGNVFAFSLP